MTLVLASASPRRRALLAALGVPFEVDPAAVDEPLPARHRNPALVARALARHKAIAVAQRRPGDWVVAADTVVVLRGRLLGKPETAEEARTMLRALRGRWHRVITGVVVARGRRIRVDHATTWVRMRAYTDEDIEASIRRGEPFDKAGGYAIQDPDLRPVECWRGCYCNVVGLSIWLTWRLLDRSGFPVSSPRTVPEVCATCPLAPAVTGATP
ncbi:MAG: Maf family protein, partial [Thermomicrobium sp.]|nr:Maf family protein [Thermomicrobium sp.]